MSNCLNHAICSNPGDSHYQDLCHPCFMFFGKWRGDTGELITKNEHECQNCFKGEENCVFSKKLDKFICIECFKKLFAFK